MRPLHSECYPRNAILASMTAQIAEEYDDNALTSADVVAEIRRQGAILDRLAELIPAMEQAAKFLDNPVTRYKAALKERKHG